MFDMVAHLSVASLMSLAALYCDQNAKILQENDAVSSGLSLVVAGSQDAGLRGTPCHPVGRIHDPLSANNESLSIPHKTTRNLHEKAKRRLR